MPTLIKCKDIAKDCGSRKNIIELALNETGHLISTEMCDPNREENQNRSVKKILSFSIGMVLWQKCSSSFQERERRGRRRKVLSKRVGNSGSSSFFSHSYLRIVYYDNKFTRTHNE